MNICLFVQSACAWEALADKLGNVNRRHDFADVTLVDFILSAAAIAPVLADVPSLGLGRSVLQAVRATRSVCATNTNLGLILLLAPLAYSIERAALTAWLDAAGVDEARLLVQAIREAKPGGLGRTAEQDVAEEPTLPVVPLMRLASQRDRIARQYANGFAEVFDEVVPDLRAGLGEGLNAAICQAQLRQLARHGDSLIARKCGRAASEECRRRAALAGADPSQRPALDSWLRADGHRRNPGTTADLLTAGLFVLLARGEITLSHPW